MRFCNTLASLVLIFSAMICGSANAVGFDCNKVSTLAEIKICDSPQLKLQDDLLNSAYIQALGLASDKTAMRAEQRAWLKQREKCSTVECLSSAMELRTRYLSKAGTYQALTLTEPTSSDANQDKARPIANPAGGKHAAVGSLDTKALKVGSFVMVVLLLVCIWLHSRGSMVIYSCYTDAMWTTLTPLLAIGSYFIAKAWLEFTTDTSLIIALVVAFLMSLQVIIQTYRSNGLSLFFLLALYAKVLLFAIYFLSIAALILSGGQTASDRRRRRNWALAGSVLFGMLTSWMCRDRQFSHIDDYLAGRT